MCRVKTGKEDCANRGGILGWGVSFCQQQASQLGCVVLTLYEGGTRCVFSTSHYTVCSVRVPGIHTRI